ncbi:hypothetical protein Z950_2754 [Sulfitobacter mediterraneus KCTC 32188]|nr:hypothetical protein Z950_2754 [Sulfitobacter mediterraneus KCTC 32188]
MTVPFSGRKIFAAPTPFEGPEVKTTWAKPTATRQACATDLLLVGRPEHWPGCPVFG